jgi:protein phosphatase
VIDGLWDRELEEIARSISSDSGDSLAKHIVATAVQNSGRDNTTAIVIEVLPPKEA